MFRQAEVFEELLPGCCQGRFLSRVTVKTTEYHKSVTLFHEYQTSIYSMTINGASARGTTPEFTRLFAKTAPCRVLLADNERYAFSHNNKIKITC